MGYYNGGRGQQSTTGNWGPPPPPPWAHWTGWNGNWGNPGPPPRPGGDLRIGDAERSEMIEMLTRHFAEGRLDDNEMRERVERATAAKTRADLTGLLSDLPPLDSQTQQNGGICVPPRRRHRILTFLVIAFLAVTVAGWLTAPWHFPWVLLLIIGFFIWRGGRFHHHRHGDGWSRQSSSY